MTSKTNREALRQALLPSEDFARQYLRRDQLEDLTALAEARTMQDAVGGDLAQRREILEAFVFYVEQHSVNTWADEHGGVRLPYVYARYVADCIRRLIEAERVRRPRGRPQHYTQDELAAGIALLARHRVREPVFKLARKLRVSKGVMQKARELGGYEIREERERTGPPKIRENQARHGDRYKRNPAAPVGVLKSVLAGRSRTHPEIAQKLVNAVAQIIDKQRAEQIKALSEKGMSVQRIARKIRRREPYVRDVAKRAGIALKPAKSR